jgi:hypothetical protein
VSRRCIGLDVHRDFAQVAIWQDGLVRQAGRIDTTAEALRLFADSLAPSDEVALEATGNTHAIVRLLECHVARVVVSNPQKTRAIAEVKVKTDKVDAQILAQPAGGRLPANCGTAGCSANTGALSFVPRWRPSSSVDACRPWGRRDGFMDSCGGRGCRARIAPSLIGTGR